jgi:hypothetical protein
MARVIDAGVGQPVGVFGLNGMLVIDPYMISSASRTGVSSVFSGVGPAPDMPGTVLKRVFPRMLQKRGAVHVTLGTSETNAIRMCKHSSRFQPV